MNLIKSYQKYKNNVYLSATIDKLDGFDYYTKELREMIDNKYLSDYIITVPIFSDSPDNKNVCEYLIKNYRNIIIYCNSQKEGNAINKLMNSIQNNCSAYIDCETKKSDRNKIIKKYKKGELPFLVNVRILVEGFDAPITKGICFMHMPSSKTTIIQIIGRALRLHEEKKFANIILPFSSKSDEDNINKFLKVMARNDSRIRKSYIDKKVGGYIDIFKDEENLNDEEENNIELRYELIFDKMGILLNRDDIWKKKYDDVKIWIEKYNKLPARSKNIVENKLGQWCNMQKQIYKNGMMKESRILMFENIKLWKWSTEKIIKSFQENYDILIEWININNKLPSQCSKNKYEKHLAYWCFTQKQSKKNNKLSEKQIKQLENINGWYWKNNNYINIESKYIEICNFIKKYNRLPTYKDNINDFKLYKWLQNILRSKTINDEQKIKLRELKNCKYYDFKWQNKYDDIKKFIDEYNYIPIKTDNKGYYNWCIQQQQKYKLGLLNDEKIKKIENLNGWVWYKNKI
jgi:hypothetical protein